MGALPRFAEDETSRIIRGAEEVTKQMRLVAAHYESALKKEPEMSGFRREEYLKKIEALTLRADASWARVCRKTGFKPVDEEEKVEAKPRAYAPGTLLVPTVVAGSLRDADECVASVPSDHA